jgi:GT2 family glycosyltransferase
MPAVTVGVINYNGMSTLPEVLHSLRRLDYPDYCVLLVDDASQDGSREYALQHYPEVRVIAQETNQGAAAARNMVLRSASTEYVLLLDNDMVLQHDALLRLMQVMLAVPGTALCHPEICDPNDPTVYHYNGGANHYLCALVSREKPVEGAPRPAYEEFPLIAGGALLVNMAAVRRVGILDEDYFFNMEDGDFSTRMTLAGYKVLNVPGVTVLHHGKPRGTSKVYYQVRNRWHFILKLYSWRTILVLLPAFVVYDLSQAVFLTMKGAGREWLRGTMGGMRDLPRILHKRSQFQPLKVVPDREWLSGGEMYVPPVLMRGGLVTAGKKFLERFFALYWKAAQRFCEGAPAEPAYRLAVNLGKEG